jgi:hypothetical protein
MISRRSAAYSSIIRNASSERERFASGASSLGWSGLFMGGGWMKTNRDH